MSRPAAIIIVVVVCTIVSLGRAVNHYRDNTTEYKKQRDEETQMLNLANITIAGMTTRQRDVTTLDAKYTKELADVKKQPDDLQRCVRNGKCELRIDAKYPVNGATNTGSMGDASSLRPADSVQRDYFTLREQIVTVAKQAGYLQDYANMQCK